MSYQLNKHPKNPANFINLQENLNWQFELVLELAEKIKDIDPVVAAKVIEVVGNQLATKVDKSTTITINGITKPLSSNANFTVSGGGTGGPQPPVVSPFAPIAISLGDSFTVPDNTQVLFSSPINVEGDLIIEGTLIEL